jgi:hypothetical protein
MLSLPSAGIDVLKKKNILSVTRATSFFFFHSEENVGDYWLIGRIDGRCQNSKLYCAL